MYTFRFVPIQLSRSQVYRAGITEPLKLRVSQRLICIFILSKKILFSHSLSWYLLFNTKTVTWT